MGKTTNISWTDASWNIARGCTKVDEDCKFCYMYRDSFDGTRYNPREVVKTKGVFQLPLKLKEPSKIFTSSLTDFFRDKCDPFREEAWDIIRRCPQHTFQILTKRPERVMGNLPADWGNGYENVWLGTSVGSNKGRHRIVDMQHVPAIVKFISFEPLYEHIWLADIYEALKNYQWAILGGESGHQTGKYRYRGCKVEWMEDMIAFLKQMNMSIFVKQLGTYLAKELHVKAMHGTDIDEFPESLRIRQFPRWQ